MTGANHGVTGAAIALIVREPLLAVPLSYASHYVCDAIPHFGLKDDQLFKKTFNIILVADFIVAVGLMALFGVWFPEHRWLIWACMITAASPDLAWAYYRLYVSELKGRKMRLDPLSRFHSWIQWSQTLPGISVELFWFLLVGIFILSRR